MFLEIGWVFLLICVLNYNFACLVPKSTQDAASVGSDLAKFKPVDLLAQKSLNFPLKFFLRVFFVVVLVVSHNDEFKI